MAQIGETPAVGRIRGFEMHIAAVSGDASENALALDIRQDLGDPLRIASRLLKKSSGFAGEA